MGYLFREVARSLRWGGTATLVAVGTIALVLVLLGLFMAGTLTLYRASRSVMRRVQVEVYLKDGLSQKRVRELARAIARMPEVVQVSYVDKDSAAAEFRRVFGGELLSLVPENPLPASFRVRLRPGPYIGTRAKNLAERISRMDGVEAVDYGRGWAERLERWLWIALGVDLLAGLAVGLAAVSAAAGTVRLTIWARREVIEVMRLVGATDRFIRRPFLLEGAMKGLVGGLLAAGILAVGHQALRTQIPLSQRDFYWVLGICPAAGAYFGLLGSRIALQEVLG